MGRFGLVEILIFFSVPVLYVVSLVWAYRDAERRGRGGVLVAILVAAAAWPLSIVIWLFVRPKS